MIQGLTRTKFAGISVLSLLLLAGTSLVSAQTPVQSNAASSVKTAMPPAPKSGTIQTLVEPSWAELALPQRAVLEPFAAQWNTWSSQEKRVWVSLANKFPQYSPVQQTRAKQRIKDWAALSPEQRRLARANYRLATQLPKGELADHKSRYEGMTQEQRTVLRENGSTSNTAAKYGGARTGLAKDAAKPLAGTRTSEVSPSIIPSLSPDNGAGTAPNTVKQ
jgi:Protein of unknown function (DUF3106)